MRANSKTENPTEKVPIPTSMDVSIQVIESMMNKPAMECKHFQMNPIIKENFSTVIKREKVSLSGPQDKLMKVTLIIML